MGPFTGRGRPLAKGPMIKNMTAAEALERALRLISRPERWGQGHEDEPPRPPCYCLHSALQAAWGVSSDSPTELVPEPLQGRFQTSFRALRMAIGTNGVGAWNDAPGREHAEVVEAMRRAIFIAKDLAREP